MKPVLTLAELVNLAANLRLSRAGFFTVIFAPSIPTALIAGGKILKFTLNLDKITSISSSIKLKLTRAAPAPEILAASTRHFPPNSFSTKPVIYFFNAVSL